MIVEGHRSKGEGRCQKLFVALSFDVGVFTVARMQVCEYIVIYHGIKLKASFKRYIMHNSSWLHN